MKKYAIAIVFLLWLGVLVLAQRGRYDFSVPSDPSSMMVDWIPDVNNIYSIGSENFRVKEIWVGPNSVHIGAYTLQQDAVDNDGLEIAGSIHSATVDGVAGNFCLHDGNEPTQSNSATGSRLWSDPNGVLYHQKSTNAGGGSKQVIVDDGSGNVPITGYLEVGEIRAKDANGLKLYDDGGNGIFVEDGGQIGIGTEVPKRQFDFDGANIRTQRYFDSDLNTNLGYETFGAGNLSGTHNSAFGRQSLYSIASGSGNSGLGNETLYSVTTGGNNVAIGSMSGKGVVGGSHNISLGYKSGYVIAGGNNNISIGSYSNYVGTGSKNIIIGYNIDLPVDAGNNQLNIGNLIYGTGLDGVDKGISTGKVGIGVTAPAEKLDVAGNIKLTGNIYPQATDTYTLGTSGSRWDNIYLNKTMNVIDDFYIYDATRSRFSIQADGTYLFSLDSASFAGSKSDGFMIKGNAYPMTDNTYDLGTSSLRWDDVWATNGTIQTSDERRKKDIADLNYGIDEINQLRPISFKWKKSKDNRTKLGLIAQEIVDILPEVVYGTEEESYGINYGDLVPIVIKAIQEQQKQIDELTKRIKILERSRK